MVRIKNRILGIPEGKLGNVVYRTMNGKTFASSRPANYNSSHSPKAKLNRNRFGIAIEFAKYVNSIPTLKNIWKSAKIKGTTSFNRIVKYNSKCIGEKSPTKNNIITPYENVPSKNLFSFHYQSLNFSQEAGMIKIVLPDKSGGFEYNLDYNLTFVFMLLDPKRKSDKYFLLDHMELTYNITQDLAEINIDLDKSFLPKLNKYKKLVIYFSSSHEVGGRLKYIWSNTIAMEFNLTES